MNINTLHKGNDDDDDDDDDDNNNNNNSNNNKAASYPHKTCGCRLVFQKKQLPFS